jgi:hypothetical protein
MIPGRLAVSKVAVGNESLYFQLRRQRTPEFFLTLKLLNRSKSRSPCRTEKFCITAMKKHVAGWHQRPPIAQTLQG